MSNRKGLLFVVSGPSGAGKTTLIDRFLREDGNSTFSVSYTTRQKRDYEVEGRDYYFVDTGTFRELAEKDCFLEWEEVHGYCYGTPRKEVMERLTQGTDIFLDIDVKGAMSVREKYSDAHLIFIEPPSLEELPARLSIRGEREIALRMKRVKEEFEKRDLFDYTVVNDKLETAYSSFKNIIETIRRKANGKDNS